MSIDWTTVKDWDREARRLEVANASGVPLEDVHFPGDNDPDMNIILRNQMLANEEDAVSHAQAEGWGDTRESGERLANDGLPSLDDMAFFDALDGDIDASWDVLN
jgi:hypothetical protein